MSAMLSFRVSEANLARVDELARIYGLSRSEYLRQLIETSIWRPAITAPQVSVASYSLGSKP